MNRWVFGTGRGRRIDGQVSNGQGFLNTCGWWWMGGGYRMAAGGGVCVWVPIEWVREVALGGVGGCLGIGSHWGELEAVLIWQP